MLNQFFKIFSAIIYTIRPSATLGACSLVLAAFNPGAGEWYEMSLLLICAFSGSSFCFLMNDIYDRDKDLLNKKLRPIATGVLPLKIAYGVAVLFGLIFLFFAFAFGWLVFLLAVLFILLTSTYSYLNVKSGLLANGIVAIIVAGTHWGVYFIKPDMMLLPASIFLFLFTIPREMLLDWLDREGDKAFGKNSIVNTKSSQTINLLITFLLIGSSFAILFIVYQNKLDILTNVLFIATAFSLWMTFVPFFLEANRKNALFGVRFSHLTFALFIVAMLTR